MKKGVEYVLKLTLDQPSPSQLDNDDLSQLWENKVIALNGKLPENVTFKQNYGKSSNITSITCRFAPENDVNVEILRNATWTSDEPDKLLTLRRNDSSDEEDDGNSSSNEPAASNSTGRDVSSDKEGRSVLVAAPNRTKRGKAPKKSTQRLKPVPKGEKKTRKKKTEKRPLTGYNMFSTRRWAELKADPPDAVLALPTPGKQHNEIVRIAGAEWTALDLEEKKKWNELAAQEAAAASASPQSETVSEAPAQAAAAVSEAPAQPAVSDAAAAVPPSSILPDTPTAAPEAPAQPAAAVPPRSILPPTAVSEAPAVSQAAASAPRNPGKRRRTQEDIDLEQALRNKFGWQAGKLISEGVPLKDIEVQLTREENAVLQKEVELLRRGQTRSLTNFPNRPLQQPADTVPDQIQNTVVRKRKADSSTGIEDRTEKRASWVSGLFSSMGISSLVKGVRKIFKPPKINPPIIRPAPDVEQYIKFYIEDFEIDPELGIPDTQENKRILLTQEWNDLPPAQKLLTEEEKMQIKRDKRKRDTQGAAKP